MHRHESNNLKMFILAAAGLALMLVGLTLLIPHITTAQTPPAPVPAASTLDQRIAQRKAERNIAALDEKTQKRLESTCANSQGKIRALQPKNTTAVNNRVKTYQQIDAKLWIMIGKLKIAQKDTFDLEKQRADLSQKNTLFQDTAQNYQQVLDDLSLINCKADTIGFKSLLETARLYRVQLREQSTAIRTQVLDNIKPILSGLSVELQGKDQ